MKNNIARFMVLAGFFGATGCALDAGEQSLDNAAGNANGNTPSEDVATAEQPLLDSAHAQMFGPEVGTPDFGNGSGWFGYALATGDLEGDGADDLVVGVPLANDGGKASAGAVRIIKGEPKYGASFNGLSSSTMTELHQPGAGNSESGDQFGSAVAEGDFNCDGHLDLAVGAPFDDLSVQGGGTIADAGSVSILYGPAFTSWQLFWEGSAGIPGVPENGDEFGRVLTAGNFNGDTSNGHACSDLAIGAPDESIGSAAKAGSVTILYGRSSGLNTAGALSAQLWDQDVGSVFGVAENGDGFGAALAAGDFNNDGKDDLAIGVPYEDYESASVDSAGLVQVLKGSSSGLTDMGNYVLELNNFAGLPLQTARMGYSLARGDFDHDGDDDLAVGTPFLTSNGYSQAGGALVYRQSSGGTLMASLRFDQDSANVPGMVESWDKCGFSLAAGDFNGDGQDDLAMGCPDEAVTANGYSEGAFNAVYFGFVSGAFAVASGQLWDKESFNTPDWATNSDYFSWTLASGDFNGDGKVDLAAGSYPFDATVNIFHGAP